MARIAETPCSTCPGKCCDQLAVTISVVDVARIVRVLNIPIDDLLARYVDEDPRERPYAFMIRRQPIALAMNPPGSKTCGCPFLLQIGDTRRCGIYDIRPGTCRVYPFSRENARVYHKKGTLCPRRFRTDDEEARRIHLEIDEYQRQWNIHAEFARQWNENPPRHASFDKLLDFVEEIIEEGRV